MSKEAVLHAPTTSFFHLHVVPECSYTLEHIFIECKFSMYIMNNQIHM